MMGRQWRSAISRMAVRCPGVNTAPHGFDGLFTTMATVFSSIWVGSSVSKFKAGEDTLKKYLRYDIPLLPSAGRKGNIRQKILVKYLFPNPGQNSEFTDCF